MTIEAVADRKPTNVIEAIACIMADLPAIARVPHPSADGKGITYPYRAIEDITAEAQGLFAKYCVVVVPNTRAREVQEITIRDNPWTDTYLECGWTIYGPGGIDDHVDGATFGMGRDNSDKGTNKAQTQGYKYLLLALLMIADPKDDNDGQTDTVDTGTTAQSTHTSSGRPTAPAVLSDAQKIALGRIATTRQFDLGAKSQERWGKPADQLTKREASTWLDEFNGKATPPEEGS